MNRRSFVQRVAAGIVGLTLARTLPGIAGAPPVLTAPEAIVHTLQRGDVFTIAGKYAVNPITGRETPHLQRFMVTAEVTSDSETIQAIPRIDGARLSDVDPPVWQEPVGWE